MRKYIESIVRKALIDGETSRINKLVLHIYRHKASFRLFIEIHFVVLMLFLAVFGGFLYGKVFIMDESDFMYILIIMLVVEVFLIFPILTIVSYHNDNPTSLK